MSHTEGEGDIVLDKDPVGISVWHDYVIAQEPFDRFKPDLPGCNKGA